MAIQRIVENDGVKGSEERGRGMRMAVQPTVQVGLGESKEYKS